MIPQLEAGILLSQKTLEEMWNRSQSCQGMKALEGWFLCLANEASLDWTGLPGLNSYNVRDMMRWSLEGSLFFNNNTYESVGGPIQGTARLPITYGQMLDDHLFYQQLAVDTHQGEVPKIL
jgi:hypothetical protein